MSLPVGSLPWRFSSSAATAPFTQQNDVVHSMSVRSFAQCAIASRGSVGLALMKIMLSSSLSSVGGFPVAATPITWEDRAISGVIGNLCFLIGSGSWVDS